MVEIDTLWNVKKDAKVKYNSKDVVEIDTLWNVKSFIYARDIIAQLG